MLLTSRYTQRMFLCGVAAALLLSACNDNKNTTAGAGKPAANTTADAAQPSGKIAYVNLDSLEANYEYFKTKKAEFEKKTTAMEAEIERLARNLQNEYASFQKKAQAGTLTQTEGEAGQKKLAQMQQDIETRRQNMGGQLAKEQDEFNKDLKKRLDIYLEKYNKDKGYDFILSYGAGSNILFANKSLDITTEVIKGMNAEDTGKTETAK